MCVYAYASDFVCAYVSPITGCFYWQASAPISWRQIFGADFVLPGCQPRTLVAAALGPIVLEGVSPKLWLPDLWGQFVFGRCQPQTLAAGSRKVSAPNSCCRISGASLFFGRCPPQTPAAGSLRPVCFLGATVSARKLLLQDLWASLFSKLLLQDLWGQFVLWKVSAPNSCCRVSGASLCFGRCQPQTLAAGSLGPACKCCRMIGVSCVFWKGSAPNAANLSHQ